MSLKENYDKITEMQTEWNESWRDKRRWIIAEEGDGTYSVHEHTKNGVAPPSDYPDKRSAAARLLQLLQIGPVAPQYYPEEVYIGIIDYKSADIQPLKPDKEIKE